MTAAIFTLAPLPHAAAQSCADISGEYDFIETSTLTGRMDNIVETYTVSEQGVVWISQAGCSITYKATEVSGQPEPFADNGMSLERTGSLSGTKLTLSGTSFFPLPRITWKTITREATSATGTVNNDSISLTGTGDITSSGAGNEVRFTWTSKVTLTRRGSAPLIVTQPVAQTVTAGFPVSFSVSAMGSAPLVYQWKRNGASLAGQTQSVLTILSAAAADAGSYTVAISNFKGTVTSQAVALKVNPAGASPSAWTETWESASIGAVKPGVGMNVDTFVRGDQGQWFIGDTVSNFEDCGPVANTAEIVPHEGRKALKLNSVANQECAENIWVVRTSRMAPLAIPLTAQTVISFYADGWLENPEGGDDFPCLMPPCADTIYLGIRDSQSNLVTYIVRKGAGYTEHVLPRTGSNPGYAEVFLDPQAGYYSRNLLEDFRRIPGYLAIRTHPH